MAKARAPQLAEPALKRLAVSSLKMDTATKGRPAVLTTNARGKVVAVTPDMVASKSKASSQGSTRQAVVKAKYTYLNNKPRATMLVIPAKNRNGQEVHVYKRSNVKNGVVTYTPLDSVTVPALLGAVAATGNLTLACERLNISRLMVYSLKAQDPVFAKRLEEAKDLGVAAWEDEATRRAFHGWDKPVYQQGLQVGVEKMYSDPLAMFLLKGAKPDKYKERTDTTLRPGEPLPGGRYSDKSDVELDDLLNRKLLSLEVVGEARAKGSMTIDGDDLPPAPT